MVEAGGVRGRASAVQYRTQVSGGGMNNSQVSTTHVLLFRVERPGQPPLQVQMKGQFMNGTVALGDGRSGSDAHPVESTYGSRVQPPE